MSNFKSTNYVVFGIGVLIATVIALAIIPGLDFLMWHLLKPQGFWERAFIVLIEFFTMWPRLIAGTLVWALISKFAAEVA